MCHQKGRNVASLSEICWPWPPAPMPFGPLELSFLSCPLLQIEEIVTLIQDETEGVPIRTVKSFMTKIPSVVTGKTSPQPSPRRCTQLPGPTDHPTRSTNRKCHI